MKYSHKIVSIRYHMFHFTLWKHVVHIIHMTTTAADWPNDFVSPKRYWIAVGGSPAGVSCYEVLSSHGVNVNA